MCDGGRTGHTNKADAGVGSRDMGQPTEQTERNRREPDAQLAGAWAVHASRPGWPARPSEAASWAQEEGWGPTGTAGEGREGQELGRAGWGWPPAQRPGEPELLVAVWKQLLGASLVRL